MRPVRLLIVLATLLALIGQGLPAGATAMDCGTHGQGSTLVPDCCVDGTAAAGLCHSSGSHHGGSLCKAGTGCQLSFSPTVAASGLSNLAREPQHIECRPLLPPASDRSADQWRPPRLI